MIFGHAEAIHYIVNTVGRSIERNCMHVKEINANIGKRGLLSTHTICINRTTECECVG